MKKYEGLLQAMSNFRNSYNTLCLAVADYENVTGTSVNDIKGFVESYPFAKSLDELEIDKWVATVAEYTNSEDFTVLDYEYLNTGGNCMVGIFEVWLPEKKQTVYVFVNEEGYTMSVVDYIRRELDIHDYDELMLEYGDWGRVTGYEKYFELYRHCLNEYVKSDCKYFKHTSQLSHHMLSDELQSQITEEYNQWMIANEYDAFETDGEKIIINPYYEEPSYDEYDEALQRTLDRLLQDVKDFDKWHADVAADYDVRESLYDKDYLITLADRSVRIPFNADTWDAMDNLLKRAIEEW